MPRQWPEMCHFQIKFMFCSVDNMDSRKRMPQSWVIGSPSFSEKSFTFPY